MRNQRNIIEKANLSTHNDNHLIVDKVVNNTRKQHLQQLVFRKLGVYMYRNVPLPLA